MATTASITAAPSRSDDSAGFYNPLYGKATSLALLSVASPVAGFLVELLLTRRYGNTGTMDAYRITGSILTIGTQLLFEFGASLTLAAVAVLMVSLIAPRSFARLLGPGLRGEGYDAAVTLLPAMTGTLVMLVLCGAMAAVLNCYGVFWTGPAATLSINVGIIICVVCWSGAPPIATICVGMLAGCGVAVAMHFVCLRRVTGPEHPPPSECGHPGPFSGQSHPWASAIPLLLGVACVHVFNVALFRRLSGFSPGSAVTYSFAFRLAGVVHLPAAAFVTVAFPAVAEAGADGDPRRLEQTAARALRGVLFMAVPCVAVIGVLRKPLVELLAGQSAMSASAVEHVGSLLGLLLVGAPTGALIGILQRVLASRGATWSVGVGSALALAVAVFGLTWTSDTGSVAILWDVAFWANTAALFGAVAILDRQLTHLLSVFYMAKLCVAGVAAGVCAWSVSAVLGDLGCTLTAIVAISGALAGIVALASAHWIRVTEATETIHYAAMQWRRAWVPGK